MSTDKRRGNVWKTENNQTLQRSQFQTTIIGKRDEAPASSLLVSSCTPLLGGGRYNSHERFGRRDARLPTAALGSSGYARTTALPPHTFPADRKERPNCSDFGPCRHAQFPTVALGSPGPVRAAARPARTSLADSKERLGYLGWSQCRGSFKQRLRFSIAPTLIQVVSCMIEQACSVGCGERHVLNPGGTHERVR